MITGKIYKRDSAGKLRFWQAEYEGDKWRTIAGIEGGSPVTSAWTTSKPKSQPTAAEQAQFEALAEEKKKLDREYRRTEEELDAVPSSPMLAHKFKDYLERVAQVFKNGHFVFSQPKLDGIRATISRHGAFSREYQRHLNVDHILEALAPAFAKNPDFVFDGELYNHDLKADFSKIASVVRKKKPNNAQRAEALRLIQYHIYDLPSAGNSPFRFRVQELCNLLANNVIKMKAIQIVETRTAIQQEELDALYASYIEEGYEGQMVRIDAPYEFDKRSKFLLKRKEFITEEFPFIRVEEGEGNWAGYAKKVFYRMADGSEGKSGLRGNQDFAKKLLTESKGWSGSAQVTVSHFGLLPTGGHRFPVAVDFHPNGRAD